MAADYIQLTRRITLAATGGPGDIATVTFESGSPYIRYTAWVHSGNTPNVSAQPMLAGQNDGAAVVVNAAGAKKVFQAAADEVRPATQGLSKQSDDVAPAIPIKSEVKLTNLAATPVTLHVYIMAAVLGGGA
jgi:hypothetical protein